MRFTRARDLVATGIVTGVLGYLLVLQFYGELPRLPTFAGVTLLALAAVEVGLAVAVRNRIRRRTATLQAVTIARAVALAKASSILGAIMLGAWLALFGYLFPLRDELAAAAHDLPSAIVGLGCSAVLIAAALWLEWCCRVPDDQDEQSPERKYGTPG
jgi:uncharacterized protein DUF3180